MIPEALSYSAAFLLGLVGSPHCVGMCGGIAGLLGASTTSPITAKTQNIIARSFAANSAQSIYYGLLFQLGRIASYAFLGAILGGSVALVGAIADPQLMSVSKIMRILASIMLVVMALSIAGWSHVAMALEKLGGRLWHLIQPLSKRFIPIDTASKAIAVGALWGFLPCGLIYSALAWTSLSGSSSQSALLMACFGLGTAPAVLSIGSLSGGLRSALNKPLTRYGFAALLLLLALYPMYTLFLQHSETPSHTNTAHANTPMHHHGMNH
ncbi:Uncharacterised protein [Zhongshania aliphaticivorans]|uniref:Urease accessory protein UreH-like transmembrane domain-containing protein n=1 Tax=Zhongshania aliphaticivorans TaxID=1470434 RepID=A0A5S9NK50_9GAMM|nr:sulfite exporter TauE/SafE family protein [Zhongshania aliphaticivorans]CAA0090541.1 Uncharacterised protein [Zhongshania aliphaticivorans]CAA0098018.1 Uncharacterised protein [Zhongshania aliphaticivorans]